MEKHTWHKVNIDKHHKEPSPRWGHCATTRNNQIIYFGGYADSLYMNDLWSFNTQTMTWKQHKTGGDVPSLRSNCTAHYDQKNDAVIVVGGGGNNKKRFNTVSILNWNTKLWTEISPIADQAAPWQRTYHSSAIMYPYLIIFGGEGIADLDDLWVFDLRTHKWKQIKVNKDKPRPCARRFHTSVLLNEQFYVIAGCHDKYRSMGDIWKINLSRLFEEGMTEGFEWQQVKMKGSSFLTRWGHTSAVFDGKIYVFGGRFCNDLQDIIIIDPERDTLKTLRVTGLVPRARRRHACVFVGGCMTVFGGFNGQYFNDMTYINVFDARPKQIRNQQHLEKQLIKWVGKDQFADHQIKSSTETIIPVHKGLMVSHFKGESILEHFLQQIDGKYNEGQIRQIVEILYTGAGNLPQQLNKQYEIDLYDNLSQKNSSMRKMIDPVNGQMLSLVGRYKNEVYYLSQEKYICYLERFHQEQFYDLLIAFGEDCIPVNKTMLAVSCQYFRCLLKDVKGDTLDFKCHEELGDARVFQVLLGYLQSGYIVVPESVNFECWMLLYKIAEYMCLSSLMTYCEVEMMHLLRDQNCERMLEYAAESGLQFLGMSSAQVLVCCMLQKNKQKQLMQLSRKQGKSASEKMLSRYLQISKFDLLQRERREERVWSQEKKRSENNIEKENESEQIV